MTSYTADQIATILTDHKRWMNNDETGTRANLTDANLRGADLRDADLRGANLTDADLIGANLSPSTRIDTGETWQEYLTETLPQLLLTSERGVEAIHEWGGHSWDDCPMHVAFNISDADHAPALLRPRVRQFVQFYDAELIPRPDPSILGAEEAPCPPSK